MNVRLGVIGLLIVSSVPHHAESQIGSRPRTSASCVQAGVYRVVHGWPVLPESEMLGIASAVAVDSHNHVFILDRRGRVWPESDTLDTKPITGVTVRMFDGATGRRLA